MRSVRDDINNYEQTVNAILSFAAFVVYDGKSLRPEAEFGIGRRMTTSNSNPISPNTNVTPDLVAQKSSEYGFVVEAKKTLDQNQSNWIKHISQIRKYDDILEGWWTSDSKIKHSNAIILIHQSRGRPFTRFLKSKRDADPNSIGSNTCVVEFNYSGESISYYFLRLEFGKVTDQEMEIKLENGINIPLDNVRMSFPNIQFYDTTPPLPLLLARLWTDIFPSKMENGQYDEKSKSTKIQVSISEITNELQLGFGSGALKKDQRSGEFPQKNWVKKAIDRLVQYKLAIPNANENEFIILYRTFRQDILDRFIRYEAEFQKKNVDKKSANDKQLSIFNNYEE